MMVGPDVREEFFGDDEAEAIWGAAAARVLAVFFKVVTVVVGDFLAGLDLAESNDPDLVVFNLGFAVRRATVVGEARKVLGDAAVDVPLRV